MVPAATLGQLARGAQSAIAGFEDDGFGDKAPAAIETRIRVRSARRSASRTSNRAGDRSCGPPARRAGWRHRARRNRRRACRCDGREHRCGDSVQGNCARRECVGTPRTLMRSIQNGTTPIQAEPSNVSRCRPSGSRCGHLGRLGTPMGKEQVVPPLGHCPSAGRQWPWPLRCAHLDLPHGPLRS